jgi:hypothetical protein
MDGPESDGSPDSDALVSEALAALGELVAERAGPIEAELARVVSQAQTDGVDVPPNVEATWRVARELVAMGTRGAASSPRRLDGP